LKVEAPTEYNNSWSFECSSSWMNDVHDVQQLNEDSDYMGHYVVICGYDADDCEFEIRDPASSRCVIFTL